MVDRLVVVADHDDPCSEIGQDANDAFLDRVHVLVLVHNDVAHLEMEEVEPEEAAMPALEDAGDATE